MSTRLTVDWTRCDGHGLCAVLLPEQVTLDEWGFPVVADVPVVADGDGDDPDGKQRRAVLACPALALRLERSG
jgi:ferredoxin